MLCSNKHIEIKNALVVQTSNVQGRMSLNRFFFLLAGSWPASAG